MGLRRRTPDRVCRTIRPTYVVVQLALSIYRQGSALATVMQRSAMHIYTACLEIEILRALNISTLDDISVIQI